MKVIKWLLLGAVFAHLARFSTPPASSTSASACAIDGRTQGAIGESNQYAAYIVLFMPGMIAAAVASRGFRRLPGSAGLVVLHRAGHDGVARWHRRAVLACAIGAYLYRHLISYSRIAGWVFGSLVAAGPRPELLAVRRPADRTHFRADRQIDATEASSGRSEIWADLFATCCSTDHLHHRLRLECVLVVAVPLLAAQPLLRAVVQPRPGRACSPAATCCSPRSDGRAAPACRRAEYDATHRFCHRQPSASAAPCSSSSCTTRGSSSGCTPAPSCAWCCASNRPLCRRRRRCRCASAPGRAIAFGWSAAPGRSRHEPADLHRRAGLLWPAVGRGRPEVHRRRSRAARAAGARLARSRARRLDDRVRRRAGRSGASWTASPPSRRTSAMAVPGTALLPPARLANCSRR